MSFERQLAITIHAERTSGEPFESRLFSTNDLLTTNSRLRRTAAIMLSTVPEAREKESCEPRKNDRTHSGYKPRDADGCPACPLRARDFLPNLK
jgi:hypothetical protein